MWRMQIINYNIKTIINTTIIILLLPYNIKYKKKSTQSRNRIINS